MDDTRPSLPQSAAETLPPGGTTSIGNASREASQRAVIADGFQSVLANLRGVLSHVPEVQLRPEAGDESAPAPAGPSRKYQVASTIGSGGMGTVLKAFDSDLRRWVAMKVVKPEITRSKEHLGRFVEEAQVCGQLEHPNIPPVHEIGIDSQGQFYFTMKLVKGRTLRDIARDLSLGRPEVRRELTPVRIAQILQQAAQGVHYANVRGVIHRDLKPENIMVGDYGEVLVMDWGLAKVAGEAAEAALLGEDPVQTARMESGLHTHFGVVQGTPSYMSPEQASGHLDEMDARTDVFGLGACLYELLCFQPPNRGQTVHELIDFAKGGKRVPPSKLAPRGIEVPPDLEAICMKALSHEKDERHADARELQQDLQSYIEGTKDRDRRRKQALALVAEGRKSASSYRELERRREGLVSEARRVAEQLAPSAAVEAKKSLWALEDAILSLKTDAAQSFSRARGSLDAAIRTDPTCPEARKALADLYWERFLEAENRRDASDAMLYRGLVEANDDGSYAPRWKGDGTLSLRTDTHGAEVTLYRYAEVNRIALPTDPRPLGRTPIVSLPLAMGSYLLTVRKEGFAECRYPVQIGRGEQHRGAVKLFTPGEIGAGFVHVPEGELIRGGDDESYGGFERSRLALPDFFIGRFPVTFAEYCELLDALAARGEEVKDHVPRMAEEVFVELGPDGKHRPKPFFQESELRDRHPPGAEGGCPVFAVNWASAVAYARWRSECDGREYDLPPEDAWEKAARGVDGRFHPWGDRFDWTFVKGGLSRPERAQPEPVGTFAADESPYGVRDMAGTIREWTSSWYDERAGTRTMRGGSWNLTVERHFRAATRFGYLPEQRATTFGFRLYTTQVGRSK